jgi:GTP cyclohydrolase I
MRRIRGRASGGEEESLLKKVADVEQLYRKLLKVTGAAESEPDFLDLKRSPNRFAWMMMTELLSSYQWTVSKLKNEFTVFPVSSKPAPMVVTRDIPFFSLCAHHGLPFFGKAHIGYVPNDKLAGLSKIPRTVKFFASKFQTQERLTDEIGDFLVEMLEPQAVIVLLHGTHLCMAMRGATVAGVETKTCSVRGTATESDVKSEFYRLIQVI